MDTDNFVWSRYQSIHDFALQPVHAVINLVGSTETHSQLTNAIQNGLRQTIVLTKPTPNYAKPRYRIQSYDIPAQNPRSQSRIPSFGLSSSEIGYLKSNFFKSFSYHKPALTIFVFDWREMKKFDWKI
jgi:hypothetical protein